MMVTMMSTPSRWSTFSRKSCCKRSAGGTIDKSAPTRTCCSPHAKDGSSHGKKKITCPLPRHGSIMPYDVTKSDHFTHPCGRVRFWFFFSVLFSILFGGNEVFFSIPYSHTKTNIRRQSFLEVLSFLRSLFFLHPSAHLFQFHFSNNLAFYSYFSWFGNLVVTLGRFLCYGFYWSIGLRVHNIFQSWQGQHPSWSFYHIMAVFLWQRTGYLYSPYTFSFTLWFYFFVLERPTSFFSTERKSQSWKGWRSIAFVFAIAHFALALNFRFAFGVAWCLLLCIFYARVWFASILCLYKIVVCCMNMYEYKDGLEFWGLVEFIRYRY